MEPQEFFKKKVIGKLTTRIIKELSLDGQATSIDEEKEYEVIEVLPKENSKLYVTNTWHDEEKNVVLSIHSNFVKDYEVIK